MNLCSPAPRKPNNGGFDVLISSGNRKCQCVGVKEAGRGWLMAAL